MAKGYIAARDGVMVKAGERYVTLARGAGVPDGADADHVAVLAGRGLLVEGQATGGVDHDPDSPAPFQAADEKAAPRRGKAADEEG